MDNKTERAFVEALNQQQPQEYAAMPVRWKHASIDTYEPCCNMPVIDLDHDESGCEISTTRPCGSELYVNWSFSVPVYRGVQTDKEVPHDAVSSAWTLVCTEGHALAGSANQRNTADSAEDFDPNFVLGGWFESQGREGDR